MKFQKGKSGNPAGRPKSESVQLRESLKEFAPKAVETLKELAEAGDLAAIKMILERTCPPLKPTAEPIKNISLPELSDQKSTLSALNKVIKLLTTGELLPSESEAISQLLAQYQKHYEATELQQRIESLEHTLKTRGESNHGK